MTEEERAALMLRMYRDADEDEPIAAKQAPAAQVQQGGYRRTRTIAIGAVRVEVPSVEYVETVERSLQAAQRLIDEQGRAIRHLETVISSARHLLRTQSGSIAELSRDLNNKIDRRD